MDPFQGSLRSMKKIFARGPGQANYAARALWEIGVEGLRGLGLGFRGLGFGVGGLGFGVGGLVFGV